MYSATDNEVFLKICLTLIFKVIYGVQMTCVSHIEIPNIEYVQIDTKFEFVSRMLPMISKGSQ